MKTKITNKVIYLSRKQVQSGMCQLVERKREASSGSAVPVVGIIARIKKAVTVSAVIVPAMITIIATGEVTMMISCSAVHPTVM